MSGDHEGRVDGGSVDGSQKNGAQAGGPQEGQRGHTKGSRVKMTAAFAFARPAHLLATFFGSGLVRPASGTWGTLAGWGVCVLCLHWLKLGAWERPVWLFLAAVAFFAGVWAAQVTGAAIGVHDHGSIVIDEVAAIWLVLALAPAGFAWQVAAFVSFRFFDVVKWPPACWFDRQARWQNGWGVMLDDTAAAAQSLIVLWGARWVVG